MTPRQPRGTGDATRNISAMEVAWSSTGAPCDWCDTPSCGTIALRHDEVYLCSPCVRALAARLREIADNPLIEEVQP